MCFGDPAKSLALARERLTPEQWERFEREFDDFCIVQGLELPLYPSGTTAEVFDWAKWAFFQGRQHALQDAHRVCMEGVIWSPEPSKQVQFYVSGTCHRLAAEISHLADLPSQTERVNDAHYERIAIAMMDDEQAVASAERWMGKTR